jgi:hypothetical protein
MDHSISDESAQNLQEILAKLGVAFTLDEAREYGEWLLDIIELLAN